MSWLEKIIAFGRLEKPKMTLLSSNAVILSAGDNASLRYLLLPYLTVEEGSVSIVNPDAVDPESLAKSHCQTVVISRYLPLNWVRALRRFRGAGGRIIYFMDDDLMDPAALVGLPKRYARKIRLTATDQFDVLTNLCDEFWVGSNYLATKYDQWAPVVLNPRPSLDEVRNKSVTTICYHGTASHQAELTWLAPVIRKVLTETDDVSLEIFGDNNVNQLYRTMPGVAILHPMDWSNYLAYTRSVRRDIGLAPLLPEPFNKGRGATKFFDYVRMGAVGIYSDVAPYRGFVRHGVDGLLLSNDPEEWKQTIVDLVLDPDLRKGLATAARERAMEMASGAKLALSSQIIQCPRQ
jgi:glycosyltransferase involved in cell wall biosynthesis